MGKRICFAECEECCEVVSCKNNKLREIVRKGKNETEREEEIETVRKGEEEKDKRFCNYA